MRLSLAVALMLLLGTFVGAPMSAPAWAQMQNNGNSVIAVPAPPPIVAAPSTPMAPTAPVAPPPPGLVQTPVPPGPVVPQTAVTNAPGAAATAGVPAAPPPPDAPPVIPNDWVPGTKVTLGVLNEVDGGTSQVSIPVGGQSQIGDLQVSVQACDMRPPTALPDDAIFLTVTQAAGSDTGTPLYRGWMLRSEPGATVVGDASETFRVIGCS
jgi:hypothetical protein